MGDNALRVVEFSSGIAAAYCGKLLVDAGAEVTVVEPPGGHPLRRRTPVAGAAPGALWRFLSHGKTTASTVSMEGVDAVIDDAEVDVPAGPLRVSFRPFGLDGPWRDRPVNEFTLQAMCGSTGKRGLPGREPVHSGGAPVEFVAGSYGAAALSCFLASAAARQAGLHLDVSLLEAGAVTMHAHMTIDAAFREVPAPTRRRTMIPSIEPTADGYVGFSTITAQQFTDFLHMIGRPDLAEDQSLIDPEARFLRRDEVVAAIRAWTQQHTNAEIIDLATAFRVPVAPIGHGANLPEWDHLRERGVYRRLGDGLLAPRRPWITTWHPGPAVARPVRSGGAADRPLEGLRVADFTAFWAGPAATHLLAALGADVVKVESPSRPDGMRFTSVRPRHEQWLEWSPVFHGVNGNKRDVSLDLHDPVDVGRARALIEWADVVIENFSPRVLDDLGLGAEVVRAVNPAAILVRMPAFGLDGPWRDRTGFAMTVEQASGMAWQTGYADGPPMDVGGVCDPLGGMHAVVALMSALRERARSGQGAVVEVPLVEVALNAAAEQVLQFALDGTLITRTSNHGPDGDPQGVYPAAGEDRWVAISAAGPDQRRRLGAMAGVEDPSDDALARWCSGQDAEALVEALVSAGIAAAVVVPPAEVAANPQLRARRFFEPVRHPVVGEYEIPSLPFRIAGREPHWYRTPPPTVGQHTAEVFEELGLS